MSKVNLAILVFCISVSFCYAQYKPQNNWQLDEQGGKWYDLTTTVFFTTDSTEIENVKNIFQLSKVSVINGTKKIQLHIFRPSIGIRERDIVLFLDEQDRTLFAIIVTVGWLQKAYELQARIMESPIKPSETDNVTR